MVDELLDRIGFTAEELPHPVELLTVERVARRADVPVTSLDSAIPSADALRREVLAEAIRCLSCIPGEQSWAALREAIRHVRVRGDVDDLGWIIRPVIAARAQELAEDPAFPFLLSGFDQLDAPELQLLSRQLLRHVFEQLWPFITTACEGSPLTCPQTPSQKMETMTTLLLTADAYRRLLGAAAVDTDREDLLSGVLSSAIADELVPATASQAVATIEAPSFVTVERQSPNPLTDVAVREGAQILLQHHLPFSTSISVAEARRRTGLSNTAFYRTFGSLTELDQLMLQRAQSELAEGFTDEFFAQVLAEIQAGDLAGGLERMAQRVEEHQRAHVTNGRPGRQLTPWLGFGEVGPVVSAAYASSFEERGMFYTEFAKTLSASLPAGLDGRSVAGTMHAVSVISDYFIRVSPDRDAAFDVAAKRLPLFNRYFFS